MLFPRVFKKCISPQWGEYKDSCRRKFSLRKYSRALGRWKRSGQFWPKPRIRCPIPEMDPQFGSVSWATALASMSSMHNLPLDETVLNQIENLGALFFAIQDASSSKGVCASIFLYLKTNYTKSIANTAAGYIADIFEGSFDSQSGEFRAIAEKPEWLKALKELQTNWTLVIRNDGFKKLSHVLSLCLALGLCDAADLDFQISGMKLFSIAAYSKHTSAIDLVDAAFETVVYFAEGGYTCFQRKSFKPLMYGSLDNEEFEELYAKCARCHEFARCGNLQSHENIDENDYEALLCSTIEKITMLISTCRGPVEKNILRRKMDSLRQWQTSFRQTRVQGGLKESAYSIGIFGGTAVGKSTIANVLMVTTLLHSGYGATDDRIITINERDKFMSNYRSFINGVLVDDLGNTKAEFVERAPTSLMIELVNNVRTYANMAEADMKGKVSVEPKCVIATKNVKDSCATIYSNEPASITRRDRITITCVVKPEYAVHSMLNEDKVRAAFPQGAPLIPDFWDIHVERSFPIPNTVAGKANGVGWETVNDESGIPMSKIGLPKLIRWIGQDSKKFYANQVQLVDNSNNLSKKIELCPDCHHPVPDVCICQAVTHTELPKIDDRCVDGYCVRCEAHHTPPPLENQFGEYFLSRTIPYFRAKKKKWLTWAVPTMISTEKQATDLLLRRLDWLETSPYARWTNWVPKRWIEHPRMKEVIWFTHSDEIRERVKEQYRSFFFLFLFYTILTFIFPIFSLLYLHILFGVTGVVAKEKELLYNQVMQDNKALPLVFKMYRDKHMAWITKTCLIIASLYGLAKLYKAFRVVPAAQGSLAPSSMEEIDERDTEVNPWSSVRVSNIPCSKKSQTTTVDQLDALVRQNLTFMSTEIDGKMYACDAFFIKSNVAIVPKHMWVRDEMKANFLRHDTSSIGGNFECFISRKHSVDVSNKDFSLVWVPNGGDWKDLSEYLPLSQIEHDVPARMVYKQKDGQCITRRFLAKFDGEILTRAASFPGARYTLPFNSFVGLCMATIISETKGPVIHGFHLGGRNGQPEGCCGILLKSELDTAFADLKKIPGLLVSKSSGTMPTTLYDVQFFQGNDVHPKSPINFLPDGTNCKYYGQVIGRSTYYSEVVTTPISAHVAEVCGVPQQWGKPKFRSNWPWQASLQHSARPSCGIEPSLLSRAVEDYRTSLLKAIKRIPKLLQIRPLTKMEVVCGIDGRRFIDKMKPGTSIGYPLSGPKSNFLINLEPVKDGTHQNPAELDPIFWQEAERMEHCYLAGERTYPVFKACLKDEPTLLSKDKVRVFQAAPVALQLLIRKYFLPIVRNVSVLPLESECAVGINAEGPEWQALTEYITKYGSDRILAGDYSKYDLRMPAQVMLAAFRILIDIARAADYPEESIVIMEGLATDICYPLMAYNGDLIQLFGSNPSGQNLTVYINSIVNSLLFRCAFFHIYKDRKVPEFREVCALITYGDDAKSSVHQDYPEFNHIAVASFLAERDMKFTMPDKESVPTPYMRDEDADFLKRKTVFHEELQCATGALDESSIFKSLHAVLKSGAMTLEQQSMSNIDSALRDWFHHGRAVYELRQSQMQEVANRAEISHGCPMLSVSYDELVSQWKDKYQ